MRTRNWGWIVARGVAGIIFGLCALFVPGITWVVLMSLFAAYALIGGIAAIVTALSRETRADRPWGLLLVNGILGIAVAAAWVLWPAAASLAFIYVVGVWAIVSGILEIGTAIRLRKTIKGEWMLALAGVLSIALGVIMWLWPLAGALALVWWIGAYAIVFGALIIGVGLHMRRLTGGRPTRDLPLQAGNTRQQHV
jgi:uncharacterized membrane protein HdeD (DUF308 family)